MASYNIALVLSLLCFAAYAQEFNVEELDDFDLAASGTVSGSAMPMGSTSATMHHSPVMTSSKMASDMMPSQMMSSQMMSSHAQPASSANPTPSATVVHPSMSVSVSSMHPTSSGNQSTPTHSGTSAKGFDGGSFIGGIALGVGLCIIIYGIVYYYKRRNNDYGRL
ncbi:hypothetical protein TrispH2_005835 [Trichoplax sp. H2]|nr:hypothetical protein TrispH2_005835 [Trichoplax sp. H2]|eukprot:RDD41889.1 hypothetical protein TrispH2_005835 [Trichoplax sp. H2]